MLKLRNLKEEIKKVKAAHEAQLNDLAGKLIAAYPDSSNTLRDWWVISRSHSQNKDSSQYQPQ